MSVNDYRFALLTASGEEVTEVNPILLNGEILHEHTYVNGVLTNIQCKVGNGEDAYDLLPYVAGDVYTDELPSDITLGGLEIGSTWSGKRAIEMLYAILHPYLFPSISILNQTIDFRVNNLNYVLEIGDTITSQITLGFSKINSQNLKSGLVSRVNSTLPIFSTGLELFDITTTDNKTLAVANAPYKSTAITTLSLTVSAKNTKDQNVTSAAVTVQWLPLMYCGVNINSKLTTQSNVISLNSFAGLTSSRQRTITFPSGGYIYLAIPQSISQTGMVLKDSATQFPVPFKLQVDYDPSAPNAITVLNSKGVNIHYNIYRSLNSFNEPTTVIIS